MKIITNTPEETKNFAYKLASKLKGNEIFAFYGDLGVGKTTFIRGLASFFGLENLVSSPTFSLMNEYQNDNAKIYHFDMYRINSFEDLESTGFFDYLDNGIFLIEWSENINEYLPGNVIKIKIEKTNSEDGRMITIEGENYIENFSS